MLWPDPGLIARVPGSIWEIADRHLSEATERIACQERFAARLTPDSTGRELAEGLLATMRRSFALMQACRTRILHAMGEDDPGPGGSTFFFFF